MVRQIFTIMCLEMRLSIKEMLRYKISVLSDFIVFTLLYIGIFFMDFSSGFMDYYLIDESSSKLLILVGYIFWQMNSLAIGCTATGIRSDALRGILEMRMQSKFPVPLLLGAQLIVSILFECITFVGVFIFSCLTLDTNFSDISVIFVAFLLCAPSVLGSFGIGLILGGVTLIEKSVGQFLFLIQTALLFISNSLSPTRGLYGYILPFTYGVEMTRNIYLGQMNSVLSIFAYLLINLIWLSVGIVVFNLLLQKVRKRASFTSY